LVHVLQVACLLHLLATCSLIAPASTAAARSHLTLVWDICTSETVYCGIINQDSTVVLCSNGRCYFTTNTLVSAVQTGFKNTGLEWAKLL